MTEYNLKPLDEKDQETLHLMSSAAQTLFDISQTCLVENNARQADWLSAEITTKKLKSALRRHRELDAKARQGAP